MARKSINCRAPGCTVRISAEGEEELLTAVLSHAVHLHQGQDTPEFRARLRQAMEEDSGGRTPAPR